MSIAAAIFPNTCTNNPWVDHTWEAIWIPVFFESNWIRIQSVVSPGLLRWTKPLEKERESSGLFSFLQVYWGMILVQPAFETIVHRYRLCQHRLGFRKSLKRFPWGRWYPLRLLQLNQYSREEAKFLVDECPKYGVWPHNSMFISSNCSLCWLVLWRPWHCHCVAL